MKYAYYPGCTLENTAQEYNQSVLEVGHKLGIEMNEISNWTCCGASSGHFTDYWVSHALSARNLALAERQGMDIAVACPACYLRLNDTRHEFLNEAKFRERLPSLINLSYRAKYEVKHILEIFSNSLSIEAARAKITNSLNGLKLVSYYGCYLVRPPELTHFDDPENPQTMDCLLQTLGAEVFDWRAKVDCCGGSLSFTNRNTVVRLTSDIIAAASEVEAEAIVTACPLCQANLETRQSKGPAIPVLYFTELLGLAIGCNSTPWFKRHMISPVNLLAKHGLE